MAHDLRNFFLTKKKLEKKIKKKNLKKKKLKKNLKKKFKKKFKKIFFFQKKNCISPSNILLHK